ncbi:hypothetical protein SADUNF_Sadunf06G0077400 [Salix dunnii]|uniref:Uncharacterized protein n=1 Tax=Salix dunnii TaxID=1413687 RepID=A0A835JY43_9ROSI|nr:hypothetical protein SADUNF_Sadunf06G0077400 [Salix dunnii]
MEFFCQTAGPLPVSIYNASKLLELDIDAIALSSNPLGKGEADDLSFIDSLTKRKNLRLLELSNSHFGWVVPDSIGYLSTQPFLFK